LRRRAETVGDIDILVTAEDSGPIMDAFVKMPEVIQILAKGPTKSAVILRHGQHTIQSDVRVVEDKSFGAALQYFTGNKEHNIVMRRIAIKKGCKLSEYGIFDRNGKMIAGDSEEGVYKALGVPWIPPELRENRGEIEASIRGKLPDLVKLSDIRGDLHIHTLWSDGSNSIQEMIRAAEAFGYEYIAITDHSKSERVANGMDEGRLLKYIKAVRAAAKQSKMRVFVGSEVDITANGELDYPDEYLKQLDFVAVSIHSKFKSTKDEMTERVLTGLSNKYVKAFCHPTGGLIHLREPYAIDLDKVFEEAAQRKIALEVDSLPNRLDLNDIYVKKAIEAGAKVIIDTDAHHTDQLGCMRYGVAMARRGWAEKKDVINAYPLKEFCRYFGLKP
jgi:DNA polymerase (family 10)